MKSVPPPVAAGENVNWIRLESALVQPRLEEFRVTIYSPKGAQVRFLNGSVSGVFTQSCPHLLLANDKGGNHAATRTDIREL